MPADTQAIEPPSLEDLPPFLTVPEVAAVLRLGRSATYEAVARGQIPSRRFGRKVRVPRAALVAFAREQLVNSPAEQAPDQGEAAGGVGR
jgi:excisionase family DNA binding protein